MGERKRTLKQDRIAKGMCPNCGAEAAPYYLCAKCRLSAKLGRILHRASEYGGVTKIGSGRHALWQHKSTEGWKAANFRGDPKAGDRRTRPRLRGIPVDVEAQLIEIIQKFARPVPIEEILEAWGHLRENRAGSIATNVISIIRAKDDRAAKNARRAARMRKDGPSGLHAQQMPELRHGG